MGISVAQRNPTSHSRLWPDCIAEKFILVKADTKLVFVARNVRPKTLKYNRV